ncbi:MAG: putative small integral membrane protein [Bradyrhizobium sp.]|jgi:predicted small integral membrane protein
MEHLFGWMEWTMPVAIFFVSVALMLAGMTIWELKSPTIERKGFIPMITTRGDRLFISLLTAAYINLGWTALTTGAQWPGTVLSFIVLLIVMRWG